MDGQQQSIVLGTVMAALSFSLIGGYYYFKNLYNYWDRKGLKGPKPSFIVGNIHKLLVHNRPNVEEEWLKKYGKVYGIYMGTTPRLVVGDLEVLNSICIKDFDAFTDHETSEFFNKFQKSFIFFQKGDNWKKVRALMSPTFTSAKIKRMFKCIDLCADDLVEYVKEQLKDEVDGRKMAILNSKNLYNLFTMDAITTCCYGLKLERAGSPNLKDSASRNDFVDIAMKMFKFNVPRLVAVAALPKALLRFFNFEVIPEGQLMPIIKIVEKLIEKRRQSSKKFDDYLQLLIDAELDDDMELNEMDLEENHHASLTQDSLLNDQQKLVEELQSGNGSGIKKKVELTDIEVTTGAAFMLLVGLETTGNLLSSCTYLLAHHQDKQEILYKELEKIVEYSSADKKQISFNYEALTSCKYLDSVLSESLRIMSPAITGDRVAARDYRIEKYNIDIPKGMVVNIPFHAILNDPDNWSEPHKFEPERFMPGQREKIKPGSYCPFGLGPRHCIGMRFSLTESKLALAKIMMQFKFIPAPGTTYPPEPLLLSGVLHCIKNPDVTFVPRFSEKSD